MWTETVAADALGEAIEALRDLLGDLPSGERGASDVALPDGTTPARVASALDGPVIWLDSGEPGRHLIALSTVAEVSWGGGVLAVMGNDRQTSRELEIPPFDGLDAVLAALKASGASPRLFGYLSYDLGAAIEELPPLPPADQALPDLWFGLVDTWLEAIPVPAGAHTWRLHSTRADGGEAMLENLLLRLERGAETGEPDGAEQARVAVRSAPDADGYRAAVARTVRRIHAGDFFEANICRRLEAPWSGSPRRLYDRMRAASPGSHGAYLATSDWAVLSVSPETYLEVRNGNVVTRPIKGTRPRGPDLASDRALAADLLASEKDAAELAMIVDLARNDLGRVCRPGSVEVTEHRAVMRLPTVHHTYSVVRGSQEPGTTLGRLLRASFPARLDHRRAEDRSHPGGRGRGAASAWRGHGLDRLDRPHRGPRAVRGDSHRHRGGGTRHVSRGLRHRGGVGSRGGIRGDGGEGAAVPAGVEPCLTARFWTGRSGCWMTPHEPRSNVGSRLPGASRRSSSSGGRAVDVPAHLERLG